MYFIINAADLASSEGELHGVRKHVYDQLVRNGLEEPRLYHLSSKEGLLDKKQGTDQETSFSQFECAFYDYTILELKQLSVTLITNELKQFINKANDSISFMKEETVIKEQKHQQFKDIVATQMKKVDSSSFAYATRDVLHEFEQLVLYLRERMRFVLNDYFGSAINVSVITGSSKRELHAQLAAQIKEWRGLGEYFLKQELGATAIRMEEAMKGRAKKWIADEEIVLQKELPFLFVDQDIEIESINVPLQDLHMTIEATNYLTFLKTKKDFFENGMIKNLKEVLVLDGVEKASNVIEESTQRYRDAFELYFQELENMLKLRLKDAILHELNRFEALFDQTELTLLEEEHQELRKYVF
ncbi:hypothetical protein H1D32_09510 [Anaerobacillus sp. CMMVII]|uniref:hypothetical protein n=1 Tax=Anaerobacillus sp. CMMVII TaxID=2755588 RepID=UPI0021B76F30|nr:hypothetical protein [Anaerobacillus sp. CMMVII]MCT8137972.1 hypothetical protein [Anaerobacillus sp. CMMVII]